MRDEDVRLYRARSPYRLRTTAPSTLSNWNWIRSRLFSTPIRSSFRPDGSQKVNACWRAVPEELAKIIMKRSIRDRSVVHRSLTVLDGAGRHFTDGMTGLASHYLAALILSGELHAKFHSISYVKEPENIDTIIKQGITQSHITKWGEGAILLRFPVCSFMTAEGREKFFSETKPKNGEIRRLNIDRGVDDIDIFKVDIVSFLETVQTVVRESHNILGGVIGTVEGVEEGGSGIWKEKSLNPNGHYVLLTRKQQEFVITDFDTLKEKSQVRVTQSGEDKSGDTREGYGEREGDDESEEGESKGEGREMSLEDFKTENQDTGTGRFIDEVILYLEPSESQESSSPPATPPLKRSETQRTPVSPGSPVASPTTP